MTYKERWYFRISGWDDEAKRLEVEIYDADYYDDTGYLQDAEIRGRLPAEVQCVVEEIAESKFHYAGSTEDFCRMMEFYSIEVLPAEHRDEHYEYTK